jgi:hypothetical protein
LPAGQDSDAVGMQIMPPPARLAAWRSFSRRAA